MTDRTSHCDVAVIGAGPIGLEMAISLKQHGFDYVQFDARQIGYTISWFAPQTKFFSSNERIAIAGVPLQTWDQGKATREEYLAYLRRIVQQYDLKVNTYEPVRAIEKTGDGFTLTTQPNGDGHATYQAKRVILCTGGTDRPRRLNIPGEELPQADHYFKDPHQYFRKRLLIVGGRNSAVEAALRCYQAGADVTISYRREQFDAKAIKYWLLPEINGLIAADKIHGRFNTVPTEIGSATVTLASTDAKSAVTEGYDFVLLLIGYEADLSLLRAAGVSLRGDCQTPVFDESTMQTNVPGLYVAGCAIGGTQDKYAIFLENCHVHVPRIIAALGGGRADLAVPHFAMEES